MITANQFKYRAAIANGDFVVDIPTTITNHIASIIFYNNDQFTVPISKSTMGGTATFTVSETGIKYGTIENGTIDFTANASDIYDRPFVAGLYSNFKCVFGSITGATHYEIIISSYGG